MGRAMFDKLWDSHVIAVREDGQALLAIDRHYVHEGSFHAFGMLDHQARPLRRPDLTFAVANTADFGQYQNTVRKEDEGVEGREEEKRSPSSHLRPSFFPL